VNYAEKPQVLKNGSVLLALPDADVKKFPALAEAMTRNRYDDGNVRIPSKVSIWVDGTTVKASIQDESADRYACVSADSLASILDVLNRGLAMDRLDWRQNRPKKGK
jgi:hypothetical protein